MRFSLFPRDVNFFGLFEKQVGFVANAAAYFRELVSRGAIDELSVDKLSGIEHQADEATHTIIDQLNKSFITPFDREDIHALAKEIDDVIDMITALANRMLVYKLTKVNKNLVQFSIMIDESVQAIACMVKGMHNIKNIKQVTDACVEINRLENLGDIMRDKVLAELFEIEKDPIAVIKWKDIYQDAETVLDICEDVAHVVQSIIMKQA